MHTTNKAAKTLVTTIAIPLCNVKRKTIKPTQNSVNATCMEDWEEVDDYGDAPFLERHVPEVSDPRALAGITRGKDHVEADPLLGEHCENRDREAQSVTGAP